MKPAIDILSKSCFKVTSLIVLNFHRVGRESVILVFLVYFNFPHKKIIVPYIREKLSEIEKQANWMYTGAATYCSVVVCRWPWSSLPANTLLLVSICPCAENMIYTAHQRDVLSVGRNLVVYIYNMFSSGKMNRLCLCLW